jgi:hypothetical protein
LDAPRSTCIASAELTGGSVGVWLRAPRSANQKPAVWELSDLVLAEVGAALTMLGTPLPLLKLENPNIIHSFARSEAEPERTIASLQLKADDDSSRRAAMGPYFPQFHPRPSAGHVNDMNGPAPDPKASFPAGHPAFL